jgi:hypothetical protein
MISRSLPEHHLLESEAIALFLGWLATFLLALRGVAAAFETAGAGLTARPMNWMMTADAIDLVLLGRHRPDAGGLILEGSTAWLLIPLAALLLNGVLLGATGRTIGHLCTGTRIIRRVAPGRPWGRSWGGRRSSCCGPA